MTAINDLELAATLFKDLAAKPPYSLLPPEKLREWINEGNQQTFRPGQRLIRPDELTDKIYLVLRGEVRLLALGDEAEGQISLGKRSSGQLLGWVSLYRGGPCEFVQASTDVLAFSLSARKFVDFLHAVPEFTNHFSQLTNPHEVYEVAVAAWELQPRRPSGWRTELINSMAMAKAIGLSLTTENKDLPKLPDKWRWLLSTPGLSDQPVGSLIDNDTELKERKGYKLPYRFIAIPFDLNDKTTDTVQSNSLKKENNELDLNESNPMNLHQLGIIEPKLLSLEMQYPSIKGKGDMKEAMAVCEMIALQQRVPFRRDNVAKIIEDQVRRNKRTSLELIGSLCQQLGLNAQLAKTNKSFIASIEGPAVLMYNEIPVVFYESGSGKVIIGHPHLGVIKRDIEEFIEELSEEIRFVLPRRVASTPTSRFGWNWFTPLLSKYRGSLALVFIASLLAQVFGLAIPLLLQQIIDKVLSQGNLSSLNVLGTAMVVMALFQGILQALRTYIFVDTTDRMDLTLGSAVIDRLLSLPLKYFEKRPVGELSQRLGELNTIRGFLTGTALLSVLNMIFAILYLVVMLIYSPFLTAIALSTFPIYLLLVFVVAPIYRVLLRRRAIAQARTQSHLIEVLGGIQTVKAQHFELTARWKWQDRYREFVNEGFRSVALGAASGEIGGFLNSLSGLLILWVGMGMVLKGEFTLGMLIAFRIIASNVTGPLLQLAGLYQGFQKVSLSMERLGDIIDQSPELQNAEEIGQISLPTIVGNVRFENVSFRFTNEGPYQLDDVSLIVNPGNFVGIVGQSGSGKSTLMKLLPRLYNPARGRIFIDDYDIDKVDLSSLRRQIGIVPQDSLLFEGTIADNISLNDPQATTESIIEAARIACAHDFIMSLGNGYATKIAERGSNLSGGQRQRIAIARTILANPQLLVMDEATSALDYDTERQLCLNLQQWAKERTVFFITHRLSTIRDSDIIVVMHQGKLVEQGKHQDLVDQNGRYSSLYRQQQSSG